MPELPEVEAARRLIEQHCQGKKITRVRAEPDEKVFEGGCYELVEAELDGKVLDAIKRRGKYLWLELSGGSAAPVLHFGMTGSWVVEGVGAAKYKSTKLDTSGDWPPKYCKLEVDFSDGTRTAFVDARRFARVRLVNNPLECEPLKKLGFDPLIDMPSLEEFNALLDKYRKGSLKIKALLLDQSFSAGVGNWVADEVLYQARMHPEQLVAAMNEEQVSALYAALVDVVQVAVEAGADDELYPKSWLFHYRWTGKRASSINGHAIDFITVGSRTSAYVPALQKLTGNRGSGGPPVKGEKRTTTVKKTVKTKRGRKKKVSDSEDDDDVDDDDEEEEEVQVEIEQRGRRASVKVIKRMKKSEDEDNQAKLEVEEEEEKEEEVRPSRVKSSEKAKQLPRGKAASSAGSRKRGQAVAGPSAQTGEASGQGGPESAKGRRGTVKAEGQPASDQKPESGGGRSGGRARGKGAGKPKPDRPLDGEEEISDEGVPGGQPGRIQKSRKTAGGSGPRRRRNV